jgi:ribosome silencing factor RsfS/YbeB/iojap
MTGETATASAPAGGVDVAPAQRIGVLGGTFDPPHLGHLWLATLAADEMHLDRVLFMPASQPPHKAAPSVSRATDRLLMTRLAIAGDSTLELCAIELERPGPSFTIDSVETLRAMYPPDTELFLVMAADSLAHIDTWREPDLVDRRAATRQRRAGPIGIDGPLRPGGGAHSRHLRARARGQQHRRPGAGGGGEAHPLPCAASRRGPDRRPGTVPPMMNDEPTQTDPERVDIPADATELAHRIVEIASDKKGNDIVMLRTAELTTMADFFVICSGRSDRQVQALAGAIVDELRDEGIRPLGTEGRASSRWVLLDFGSVIVHVFAPEEREFYGLERLWGKAAQVVRIV